MDMRLGFCLIIVSILTSSGRSDESKLVGTWTIPIGDAKTYITYRPDHRGSVASKALTSRMKPRHKWSSATRKEMLSPGLAGESSPGCTGVRRCDSGSGCAGARCYADPW